MARPYDTDESFNNEFGASLDEIRVVSTRLDQLLSRRKAFEYDTKASADRGTASLLLYWRFTEQVAIEILREHRLAGERDEYAKTIVENTALTKVHPVDSALGDALVQSAKRHGGRPAAGVATLTEIQTALGLIGDEVTVSEIIESGAVTWDDGIQRASVEKRINRGLDILEDAGYVTSKRDGRTIIWSSDGIESLSFPQHSLSNPSSTSSIDTNAVSSVGN
jgi:DNA-binding transcriptional ArsR family regulator